jgi:hypothetical protein
MENTTPIQPNGCPPSSETTARQCCPIFNPEPWQEKTITWDNKIFVTDHVKSFLHIPLNMNQIMIKNMTLIEKAGAKAEQGLMLADDSLWGSEIFIDVTKEVPGAKMTTLSGTFLTKVFEGPYKNCGKWAKEMVAYVKAQGKELKKIYFCYTSCPACAKAYGKNYVVLFAQIN